MDSNPFVGVLLYMLGGLTGACFYLPFKKVKDWAWESYWMVYAVVGLVVVPWVLVLVVSPNVFTVLKGASPTTLLRCFLFGAMWGVGGLTWGLMIRYLGVGLGLAVGCGLCASAGTLIPPIINKELGTYMAADWGIATLVGVAISLVGIVVTGMAGMSKERELSAEQKKAAVAEFDFTKGILVALFSGIMSAGMAFGLGAGRDIEIAARHVAPVTSGIWQGIPVLVVVLAGGFAVNFLWCLYLNFKNKTTGDYLKAGAPLVANVILSGLAGAIWCSQFIIYKIADSRSGDLAFAGWTVLMSSMIIFSTLLGIAMQEWKGSSGRTKSLLGVSLAILVTALVVIGYGNYLKPKTTQGIVARVESSTIVVRTEEGDETSVAVDNSPTVTLDKQQASLAQVAVGQQIKISQSRKGAVSVEACTEAKK
jgi:L-rhamnose-H+ transport protein